VFHCCRDSGADRSCGSFKRKDHSPVDTSIRLMVHDHVSLFAFSLVFSFVLVFSILP
jgi:hypothetical protein